jgi:hypothetical protein
MLQVARTHWVPITPGSKALLAPDGADEVDSRAIPGEPAVSHTGTATILFTDLVGSTTLRAQLGEERAEAHRQAHHRLLADAIASHPRHAPRRPRRRHHGVVPRRGRCGGGRRDPE